ncbi:MAG: phosphoribosylformylglycinamidine cyclo-ligase [Alphaproteobacteria bacterium GM202ARS2]|nr:phosphoribosylformylglycinamidine cyclo-ligase [Alphaproteobacteria bacterium GM202ARS2]
MALPLEKTDISTSYRDSGVDTLKGQKFVERITPLAKTTRSSSGIQDGLGGFGGLFDLAAAGFTDPVLVAASDGVGSKVMLARTPAQRHALGIDLVAMCVNDLAAMGAQPLFFLDYYACSTLEPDKAVNIIEGIKDACLSSGCALLGGETAEMPGLYRTGHFDLAGFAVGALERKTLKNTPLKEGDLLFALPSSGLHANGFSLVRHIIDKHNIDLDAPAPFAESGSLRDALLTPTRLYVKECLALKQWSKGFAHITGGGISENIQRILPPDISAHIDLSQWTLPPLYQWLAQQGHLSVKDLRATFNCGIGMVIAVSPDHADALQHWSNTHTTPLFHIGHIASDKKAVHYHNVNAWNLEA